MRKTIVTALAITVLIAGAAFANGVKAMGKRPTPDITISVPLAPETCAARERRVCIEKNWTRTATRLCTRKGIRNNCRGK